MPTARFLLPLAIVAVVWWLSSQPSPGPDLGGLQSLASYLAHFVVYAALWTSLAWALRWRLPALAFTLTVAYGAVDEVHQSFVDGRDATVVDLAVDALGAAAAWALTGQMRRRRPGPAPGPAPGPVRPLAGTPTGRHSR